MKRPYRSVYTVAGAFLALSLMFAACGNSEATVSEPNADTTPVATTNDGMDHDHGEMSPVADGARRIEVNSRAFEFDPDEITVGVGEDVAIVLSSEDMLHDFVIDGIEVHVAANQGETAEGGLRAEKPGEYTFYCSIPGHREAGMEGTLIVEG